METLATRTRGEDIFIAVKNACICSGLDLKYLRGICTNGAPAMTGNQQGFVTTFSNYVSHKYDNKEFINFHCIIHQEALRAKSVTLTLSLPRSSIDDLVFSVFTSNFFKLSYKMSLLKNRFVTLFFI